ncbi:MAG: hypothetical protein AAAFM81_15140 [Pseudomonadota bacterium]
MESKLTDSVIELIIETLSDAGVQTPSRADLIQALEQRMTERDWAASYAQALITPNEYAGALLQFALHTFLTADALKAIAPAQFESQRQKIADALMA